MNENVLPRDHDDLPALDGPHLILENVVAEVHRLVGMQPGQIGVMVVISTLHEEKSNSMRVLTNISDNETLQAIAGFAVECVTDEQNEPARETPH